MAKKELEEAVTVDEATPEMEHIPEVYREEGTEEEGSGGLKILLVIVLIILVAVVALYVFLSVSKNGSDDITEQSESEQVAEDDATTYAEEEAERQFIQDQQREFVGVVQSVFRPYDSTETVIVTIDAYVPDPNAVDLYGNSSDEASEPLEKTFIITVNRGETDIENETFDTITQGKLVHVELYENIYDAPEYAATREVTVVDTSGQSAPDSSNE